MSSPLRHLSPELRVLFASARSRDRDRYVREALSEPIDWQKLVLFAERERATPAVWNAVKTLPDFSPPQESGVLQNVTMVTEFRMFHLEQHLKSAVAHLGSLGIEVLLLKGAGLGLTHYGSFAERPMVDLDVLVHPERAKEAWEAMRARGWTFEGRASLESVYDRTHHHLPPLLEPSGTLTTLEVHTALHPRNSPIEMPAARVWERSRVIDVGGHRARVPCAVDQMVHLCTHYAWSHALDSAGWRTFRDLDRILSQDSVDLDDLVEEATRAHARSACYWTLRLARALVGVEVSDDLLRALAPPRLTGIGGMLERAYTFAMMPDADLMCPSETVSRAFWSLGMKPRWSGHGEIRPWHFSDLFVEQSTTALSTSKFLQHWTRIPRWGRYLARIAS